MKAVKTLSLALALAFSATAAIGCSSDPSKTGDDGGGSGDGGGGDGSGSAKQIDASGTYNLHTTYDLATNAPGAVGDVVNAIIDATDDPEDPTKWVVDLALAQMPNGTLKTFLQNAEPFVIGYLNDRVTSLAPDLVTTMKQIGSDFGQISKHFGLNETLAVSKAGTDYTSVHSVLGAHFKIDMVEKDLDFAAFNVSNVVVNNVGVTLDATGKLTIAQHKVPLQYGKVLKVGLDGVIIPMIYDGAHNLNELLAHEVDCQAVGQAISDAIASALGFSVGGASTFAAACTAGLNAGATYIYSKIDALDSSVLEFDIAGTSKALDKNNDKLIDTIQTGTWAGQCSYAGTAAPLSTATFFGERQ